MIPILYESTETAFASNGIGRLVDCISCLVTEERNGIFEVEFQYPVDGKLYNEITEGRIISVTHDDTRTRQPFIIYRRSAPINGIVTFNAHHVSYNLSHCILQPFTATSVADAFSQMASKSITPCAFTFWTDKATSGNFAVTVPISIKEILGGVQGSILDVYGSGEYAWDKYTVRLYQNRGQNSGVTIRYGKNLVDLTQERDASGVYNSVIPYWSNGETIVMLGTEVISKSGISAVIAVPLDMSGDFENAPTAAQLRSAAQTRLNNSDAWIPDENITIDFVALWQTDEYKDVAVLQRVKLCDTVTVIHPKLGLTVQAKVVKTVYNTLLDKYDKLELGQAKTSFAETITKAIEATVKKETVSTSMMKAAIDHATEMITGGLGGHVVFTLNADGEPQEICIMDTDDIQTAVNVLRINQNGIGFSTTGYNGQYTTAWTIDGHFNADFITAGFLSANIIHGGTLKLGGSGNGNGILEIYDANGNRIGRLDNTGADIVGNLHIKKLDFDVYVDNFTINDMDYAGHPETTYPAFVENAKAITIALVDKTEGSWPRARQYHYINDMYSGSPTNQTFTKYYLWESQRSDFASNTFYPFSETYARGGYTIEGGGSSANYFKFSITASGFGTDGDDYAFRVNSSRIYAVGNGYKFEVDSTSGRINDQTIQVASSSSKRYKHGITSKLDSWLDPHRLYKLETKQFVFNDDHKTQYPDMEGNLIPGFIAEEVAEIYPSAVIHDRETGEIESWDERRILPGMLALIQEQKKQIDELTARLERLEALML